MRPQSNKNSIKQLFIVPLYVLWQPYENFEIGAYMGGRIDLGYANEADWLIPEEG